MGEQKFSNFIAKIKKVKQHRRHKITNSYGILEGYKKYIQLKPDSKDYILTKEQYRKITRQINMLLVESLLEEGEIIFPHALGRLEIRKFQPKVRIKEGKIINSMPIDWNQTLNLWYEDEESRKEKRLVRKQENWIYKIFYNRNKADYTNKSFYRFHTNRQLKLKIKEKIQEGNLEAFLIY